MKLKSLILKTIMSLAVFVSLASLYFAPVDSAIAASECGGTLGRCYDNLCCSQFGYCTSGPFACCASKGCQWNFGRCDFSC